MLPRLQITNGRTNRLPPLAVRWASLAVCLFPALVASGAGPNGPAAKQAARKMREVLEQNFQAVNEEDLKKLLSTMSQNVGTPEQISEFKEQAESMFRETDVYMRLVDFQLTAFQPPMAEALVKQMTLPANEKDSPPATPGKLHFRNHSALLPDSQLVEYRQLFRLEGGKWKVHQIISAPTPVAEWPTGADAEQRQAAP